MFAKSLPIHVDVLHRTVFFIELHRTDYFLELFDIEASSPRKRQAFKLMLPAEPPIGDQQKGSLRRQESLINSLKQNTNTVDDIRRDFRAPVASGESRRARTDH